MLRHRGRANPSDANRTVLYLSYCKDWFKDSVNFQSKQTRAWDAWPRTSRKLFARLDSQAYTLLLEQALTARGGDPAALASAAAWRQASLEL